MKMKVTEEAKMKELRRDIRSILSASVSTDYIGIILEEIEDDVIRDVAACSSYEEDGSYNEDDIRLAIGRVLMNRMNITD